MGVLKGNRIFQGRVKSIDLIRTTNGAGNYLKYDRLLKKRKHREQIGLDTQVVYAVNDEYSKEVKTFFLANALNILPNEYGRKAKSEKNRRGLI